MMYHLPPAKAAHDATGAAMSERFRSRTDRNVGCLVQNETIHEQDILRDASIAVIGLGGMGGFQAEIFTRLGIGTLYIADIGTFDESNINRQWGACASSIGRDKAFETANRMREIADDYHLFVCPAGLNEETADFLVQGRDVVIDMIEFWSLADRILLHRACARHGVVAINCNSIVHASFGARFDYTTRPSRNELAEYETLLERYLGMDYERARELQTKHLSDTIPLSDKIELMEAVYRVFIPEEIEYIKDPRYSTTKAFRHRLLNENKAPVISVNPPFAAGWCASEAYFEIVSRHSPIERDIRPISTFPIMTRNDIGKKTFSTIDLSITATQPRIA